MNRQLRLFFSLRRLPPEFADVDRLTLRYVQVALVILAPVLFPGRHYLLYPIGVMLILFIGRFIGFMQHDRAIAESPESVPATQPGTIVGGILIAIGVALLLILTVHWAWTTRDPIFMMQLFFGAVTLSYCVGRYWARVAMGLLDIVLLVGALVFYFEFPRAGFLAAAAYAALVVWRFLFRKNQRPTQTLPAESLRT